MRGINSDCVDLIYLDPPFNSNADYSAPVGSPAAGAHFVDTWTLQDIDVATLDLLEQDHPKIWRVIQAAERPSDKSYLIYMARRLLEMKRILKPSGSIYLHCDDTMSHYLKVAMDAIFGRNNYQNHITWNRSAGKSDANRYGRCSDHILFYAGDEFTWNKQYTSLSESSMKGYNQDDGDGRGIYQTVTLTEKGERLGEIGDPWRGFDPRVSGRVWRAPRKGLLAEAIDTKYSPGYNKIEGTHARLEALHDARLIVWTSKGTPRVKFYLDDSKGKAVSDIWDDISYLVGSSKERTEYPTQKPLALLERIIKASSNRGDVVFDPFCGCATTLVAADRLERKWIGADLSSLAVKLVRDRIEEDQGMFKDIISRKDIPKRTDVEHLPKAATHKNVLYGQQDGQCAGCETEFGIRHLTVDHIIAQSVGGTDHIENLQLLCASCNSIKGNRGMEYLIDKLAA